VGQSLGLATTGGDTVGGDTVSIFMSCKYDDVDPATYKGIELQMKPGAKREVFNTGDPLHDYLTAGFVATSRAGDDAPIFGSSSIDHFVMDGGAQLDAEQATPDQLKAALKAAEAYLEETP
jgi:hypothetical protein